MPRLQYTFSLEDSAELKELLNTIEPNRQQTRRQRRLLRGVRLVLLITLLAVIIGILLLQFGLMQIS